MRKSPKNPLLAAVARLVAAALLATATAAGAVPVRGLYEASVAVPDQGAGARDAALRRALEVVLVRVAGSRAAIADPAAQAVLARAATLVQGYGYESAPAGGLALRAQFDPRAVDAALRQQGLPVWGGNRPTHLLLIALRDDGQPRGVLDAATAPQRAAVVGATAAARGVPITWPVMDAADRAALTFTDAWMQNDEAALRAARRYNTDRVVFARVGREGGQWVGQWSLLSQGGPSERWATEGATLEQALAEGLHGLADREAQTVALESGSARDLQVQVAGVRSLRDYSRVLGYLRGVGGVRSAQVAGSQDDTLLLAVRLQGDPEAFARTLAAGGMLDAREQGLFASTLSYVLVR